MKNAPFAYLILAASLALAGCGKEDNDPGPGGVTVGEARALDEAAEMIEAQRLPAELVQPAPPPVSPASGAPVTVAPAGAGTAP